MADIDEACDYLAYTIAGWLAPYQPDSPPMYPNPVPTAGQIPATLVAYGYPIQTHVMKRLENHLAQIAVFDMKEGNAFPFYNRLAVTQNLSGGTPSVGTESFDVTREKKRVGIQVWASTQKERQNLFTRFRLSMGDAYRLHHPDGSLTLFKYIKLETQDFEQMDSVYVRTAIYEADFTVIAPQEAARVDHVVPEYSNSGPTPPPLTVDTM